MLKIVLVLALIAVGTTQTAPPQSRNCSPPERRTSAIRHTRDVNAAEGAAFFHLKGYQQLEQLPIRPLPHDYVVQLATDGEKYALSIKDKTDACHEAMFSDQVGVIYTGVPIQ